MFPIDFRSIYLSYLISAIVSLALITMLFVQMKRRYPGTTHILLSFGSHTLGVLLLFLRDIIPDWLSILAANTLLISAGIFLLFGLERFVDKRCPQIQNYLLITIYFILHSYFYLIEPDLKNRELIFSIFFLIMYFQSTWLLFKRTSEGMRSITRGVGLVLGTYCLFQISRIFIILSEPHTTKHYFTSNDHEIWFTLIAQIVFLLLAYSLTLMYNKRLLIDFGNQEKKLSKIFHSAPLGIILTKLSDGQIFEVNDGFQVLSEYSPSEIIGRKSLDINFWNKKADRKIFTRELQQKSSVKDHEVLFRKKSGKLVTGLISAEVISINNEQCVLSVIKDISNRKQSEEAIKKSAKRLHKLNATKDKFFTIIAHDLKSPFNGILGFSELLIEKVKDEDYEGIQEYAEIINKSSKQAMNLLSNLMEWSKSQTGRIQFDPEYLDVVLLIHSVTKLLKISAQQKALTISLNLPNNLIILADKVMLETILRNLLSNAIKFTAREGEIVISAQPIQKRCLVTVKDNGIGIEKKNLDKLFRIDGAFSSIGTENEKGTGLGLILCKDFIERHNGKIWVESEAGKGSTFCFSIPKG